MEKINKQTLMLQIREKQRAYASIHKENPGSECLNQLSREIGQLNVKIYARR
jgi:hypothetical protein